MASSDLDYRTVKQYVQMQLDYVTANAPVTVITSLGPFITAVAYAVALVAIVLQRLVQLVLKAARLSTSTGDDVDSFVADFGLSRGAGSQATGTVTFGRFTPAVSTIFIPDGTAVQTSSATPIRFFTVASTLGNYDTTLRGHLMLAGSTSADVLVQAEFVGTQGNAAAGAINRLASGISGIDTVVNGIAFTSGEDAESDDDVRQNFIDYIQSLSKATATAIGAAVQQGRQQLLYSVNEVLGSNPTGIVSVYIDDGSGNASGYVSDVTASVNAVRPVGVRIDVTAASVKEQAIIARVAYDRFRVKDVVALRTLVRSAILAKVNATLAPGAKLNYAPLYGAIFGASSPGDAITTSTLLSTPSTTLVLKLNTTQGMSAGQLLDVSGYSTTSGNLPQIRSIDDIYTVTLSAPLSAVPPGGTTVTAFSVLPQQVTDIHVLLVGNVVKSTTIASGVTSGGFVLASGGGTGISPNDYLIITDETVAGSPRYFQTNGDFNVNPTASAQILQVGTISTDTITLKNGSTTGKMGMIDSSGTWTEAGTGTVALPAVGTKVVVISSSGNQTDVTATASQVIRCRASGPNELGLQMEFEV